ncbi:MAG: FtsX-like permease family protein, partial [Candidatus Lokiarchaeota archaeon]|nr:FtsX-like permease family protein [Candidatus Lokiarchaeota archaeon]
MIMRAIGSKIRNIRRILFLEGMLALIPSLISSLAGGMIISSLFLTDRVYLPPLYIPFLLIGILITLFIALNYVILVPITKNLKKLSFKDITLF